MVIPMCPITTPASRVAVTDPKPMPLELIFPEVVSDSEREENGDLRIVPRVSSNHAKSKSSLPPFREGLVLKLEFDDLPAAAVPLLLSH